MVCRWLLRSSHDSICGVQWLPLRRAAAAVLAPGAQHSQTGSKTHSSHTAAPHPAAIRETEGMPPDSLRLIHSGVQLENEQALASCGRHNEAIPAHGAETAGRLKGPQQWNGPRPCLHLSLHWAKKKLQTIALQMLVDPLGMYI